MLLSGANKKTHLSVRTKSVKLHVGEEAPGVEGDVAFLRYSQQKIGNMWMRRES